MTIDEAIEKYISNAEYERTHGNLQGCLVFKQLAEWLKELRFYRTMIPSASEYFRTGKVDAE